MDVLPGDRVEVPAAGSALVADLVGVAEVDEEDVRVLVADEGRGLVGDLLVVGYVVLGQDEVASAPAVMAP